MHVGKSLNGKSMTHAKVESIEVKFENSQGIIDV